MGSWNGRVEQALEKLDSLKLLRSLRPIHLADDTNTDGFEFFDGLCQWDRASVEVEISETTFHKWLLDIPSPGDDLGGTGAADTEAGVWGGRFRKLILFSSNDYLALSSHPAVIKAAAQAVQKHGMGPRGSALICGYTSYHRSLESSLAELKSKEDCLLCPTGFSANMAFMTAVGNVSVLLAKGSQPSIDERVAVFSDALNHASIVDGIRLAEKQKSIAVFVYQHCDMRHLNELLTNCPMKKKVVITDSLFSMDGDFAPLIDLVKLRKKHRFLLAIDDAHATFVCGQNGGGAAELFNCANDVDICMGTLSKAAGCHGGFIACSKKWKQLIQSRGRSFIFSTSTPVPIIAAAHAAVIVAKKEMWRRRAIWNRVQDFRDLTGIPVTSPIISLIVGSEATALKASRHLLEFGFHITAIRPPTVAPNSCRLRITLSAAHTLDDLRNLTAALSQCVNFSEIGFYCTSWNARL
ncbi:PREDICTED: 8-amino-7-oxononanoate synthase-like isoform X1 [Nicotiana attenuata]|uniref:8-amino-7-oxononanoate synthase n=1 Tax=Nicotiana attenuata TaxID=49451 RepID=A0A1J6KE53_NICAT|nr:PREDICTED: 8-amino-7-oxononanoate synthase-like isoform X1 [Nicotiana attenuata]OIT23216.1 8-amino-7-oxononanoate synthase [Nicotiana attenuata]